MLVGWGVAAAVMLALWVLQLRTRDAGIVDVGWAALLGVLALFYGVVLDGAMPRRVMVAVFAAVWSFRLAAYILFDRVIGKEEDGRYQQLRQSRGATIQRFLFFFFQLQGLLDVVLSLSFVIAMLNPKPALGLTDAAAMLLWIVAVGGESLADRQLARFRASPDNRGKVCQVGLWRYSRHPNYFFEWLHWWVYVLFSIGSGYWWLSLPAPALMLFFILKVTGIPPTEARALASRGDAYRRYQQTTSALIPWFPKREST
jgi:steroid 5-alpha reductase family enzyme